MKKAKRFAGAVTVGEKGQIVIPKQIRDLFEIAPGDTLLVLADTRQGIAIVKDNVLFEKFSDKFGMTVEGDEGDEQ
ncbi:MAG: AbrB/MazE/SpoVT family DNA-binding domain-containing protein [Oscillibacter sp.]|jgi:AbrB family looped-hinge helix DNA binding protein|nr:AbrB/MazE/SpoVT family DNA-binding domain-containing protein [Oscillibacter sp.]